MEKDERMVVKEGNHLDGKAPAVEETAAVDIPPVVLQVPIIAAPEPVEPMQTFTVVATDLPASELLFALARDARMNLDIDPSIDGRVSINAIDQTLPQILKRVSRQVALRYYVDGPNLVIARDNPFMRTYRVDYLNMTIDTDSTVGLETALSEAGDEGAPVAVQRLLSLTRQVMISGSRWKPMSKPCPRSTGWTARLFPIVNREQFRSLPVRRGTKVFNASLIR